MKLMRDEKHNGSKLTYGKLRLREFNRTQHEPTTGTVAEKWRGIGQFKKRIHNTFNIVWSCES